MFGRAAVARRSRRALAAEPVGAARARGPWGSRAAGNFLLLLSRSTPYGLRLRAGAGDRRLRTALDDAGHREARARTARPPARRSPAAGSTSVLLICCSSRSCGDSRSYARTAAIAALTRRSPGARPAEDRSPRRAPRARSRRARSRPGHRRRSARSGRTRCDSSGASLLLALRHWYARPMPPPGGLGRGSPAAATGTTAAAGTRAGPARAAAASKSGGAGGGGLAARRGAGGRGRRRRKRRPAGSLCRAPAAGGGRRGAAPAARRKRSGRSGRVPHGRWTLPASTRTRWE